MPIKTAFVTENVIRNASLPNHGGKYVTVQHGFVIDQTKAELLNAGFTINQELYKTSADGQMAQGIYHLNYGNDADMGLMFAWSNSYNKMMRFKCAVGAHVFICSNGVVNGDMGNYKRKHIGNTALSDVTNTIQSQISQAKEHYDKLVEDKEMLKNIILTPRDKGRILGELFAKDEILTLTQVGIVKREMDKPTHVYNADVNSAWSMYNHITFALKESHPMTYLDDHKKVHTFFVNEYGQLITPQIQGEPIVSSNFDVDQQTEQDFVNDDIEVDCTFGVNFL
jgi:hypothetical protein